MRFVIVCGTDVGQSKDTVISRRILTFEPLSCGHGMGLAYHDESICVS